MVISSLIADSCEDMSEIEYRSFPYVSVNCGCFVKVRIYCCSLLLPFPYVGLICWRQTAFEEYQVIFLYALVQKRIVKIWGSLLMLQVHPQSALKDITNRTLVPMHRQPFTPFPQFCVVHLPIFLSFSEFTCVLRNKRCCKTAGCFLKSAKFVVSVGNMSLGSTAVDQVVACAPVTQRARVRSPVGTSFLGEVFFGVFLTSMTNVRKL